MNVTLNFTEGCGDKTPRVVFRLGLVSEQSGPVAPTPQYRQWPLFGEVLMAFQLTASQYVDVAVAFVDKKGNPAKVDGTPAWAVDNPNVAALQPAVDGLSCKVLAAGPLGTAKVSVTADADLGAGVVPVAGVLDVDIVAGQATLVTLTPGTPQEQ